MFEAWLYDIALPPEYRAPAVLKIQALRFASFNRFSTSQKGWVHVTYTSMYPLPTYNGSQDVPLGVQEGSSNGWSTCADCLDICINFPVILFPQTELACNLSVQCLAHHQESQPIFDTSWSAVKFTIVLCLKTRRNTHKICQVSGVTLPTK